MLLHSAAPPSPLLPADKQSLRSEPWVIIVSCKDGRQLLVIPGWASGMRGSTVNTLPPTSWATSPAPVPWLWLVSPGQGQEVVMRVVGQGSMGVQGLTGAPLPPSAPGKLAPPGCPDLPGHSTGAGSGRQQGTLHMHAGGGGWMVRTGRLVRGGGQVEDGSWGDKCLPEAPHRWHWELGPPFLWPRLPPHAACRGVFLAPRELGHPDCYYKRDPPTSRHDCEVLWPVPTVLGKGLSATLLRKSSSGGVQGQWDRAGGGQEGVTEPLGPALLGLPGFAPETPW